MSSTNVFRGFLPIILTIIFALPSLAQDTGIPLQERLNGLADAAKVPGYSAIKITTEATPTVLVGGLLKAGEAQPFTQSTIQVQGALSPLVVYIAVMKAVEQGHFSLDTPINEHLPFQVVHPADRNTPITIRHLLAHTSGLLDETGSFYKMYLITDDINYNHEGLNSDEKKMVRRANLNARFSLRVLLEKSLTAKGDFYSKGTFSSQLPGDGESVSLTGLSVLALIIESSTGYFFDQYADEFIFSPLGITSAAWSIPSPELERAVPHLGSDMSVVPDYNQILYPSAGFRSSTIDAAKLLDEVLKGLKGNSKILKTDSWKLLFDDIMPDFQNFTVPETNRAPIEVMSSYNQAGYIVIGAQNYGSTSVLLIEPQKGEAVYFASNTSFSHLNRGGYFLSEWMRLIVEPYE